MNIEHCSLCLAPEAQLFLMGSEKKKKKRSPNATDRLSTLGTTANITQSATAASNIHAIHTHINARIQLMYILKVAACRVSQRVCRSFGIGAKNDFDTDVHMDPPHPHHYKGVICVRRKNNFMLRN